MKQRAKTVKDFVALSAAPDISHAMGLQNAVNDVAPRDRNHFQRPSSLVRDTIAAAKSDYENLFGRPFLDNGVMEAAMARQMLAESAERRRRTEARKADKAAAEAIRALRREIPLKSMIDDEATVDTIEHALRLRLIIA
jgi:hypothetical protein